MSHYPFQWPYGQYQAHGHIPPPPPPPPPPQPQQQFGYQQPESYSAAPPPPHVYNPPYGAAAAAIDANRHTAQGSFHYNAAQIPGLGAATSPPSGNPYHVGSVPSAWAQQPHYSGSVANFHVPPPHAIPPFTTQQPQHQHANGRANAHVQTRAPAPIENTVTASIEMEEGELSEGQFEDLYEPRQESRPSTAAKPTPKTLVSSANASQPTSAADTPDAGFYADEEDETTSKSDQGRERSTSYSPFLSPRETQDDSPASKGPGIIPQDSQYRLTSSDRSEENNAGRRGKQPATRTVAGSSDETDPGTQALAPSSASAFANNDTADLSDPDPAHPKDYLKSFKSLTEAKKEAQKAILRLWPLGVKYPTYIEEGFDEKVIKRLFGDLHLELPKEAAPLETEKPQPVQGVASLLPKLAQAVPMQQSPQQQKPAAAVKDPTTAPEKSGEERKDRIARLLAAKAAKGPAAAPPKPVAPPQPKPDAISALPSSAAPAVGPSSKGKAWGEKERILQAKIAALHKSREAQALKSGTQGGNLTTGSAIPQVDGAAVAPAPANTGPLVPLAQPTPSQPNSGIQALVVSADKQLTTVNQRKRPVAADFVDYSSAPGSLKRPFGKVRNETSLIIDLSDASDDEEMEMDMGSPVEDTSPIQSREGATSRGPSIRDFPPLPDVHRPVSSPAPSQTPPGGLVNGKRHHTELTLKEREIQEMRRKIALAEAKRKAKKSSTPVQAAPELKDSDASRQSRNEQDVRSRSPSHVNRPSSQSPMDPSSTTLPKGSAKLRLDPLLKEERRGRIVSLDLPRVDSSLEEKLRQLEELRAAEERLRAEIEKERVRKELLKEELELLAATSSEDDAQRLAANLRNTTEVHASRPEDTSKDVEASASGQSSASDSGDSTDISMEESGFPDHQSKGDAAIRESVEGETVTADTQVRLGEDGDDTVSRAEDLEQGEIHEFTSEEDSVAFGQSLETTVTHESPNGSEGLVGPAPEEAGPNPANNDDTIPMELDSRSPSPGADSLTLNDIDTDSDANPAQQGSVSLPDQISSTTQPREEVQEIEAEATGEEAHQEPKQQRGDALMSYESPLRIFRAYRFHPDFKKSVAGGLKSLTYSNKIDPLKVFCPYELDNQQCPENCEFQHFSSITIPDDHILVQLGKADDFSNEQRPRFIQGLRELLASFRTHKGRDFDSISRGIIEYRSRFLGDKSKILNLGSVSI
ncbi:protein red1 [Podospora australis]|uniref:Protein red1 n=1 Tax=Podospora australis TaxID=1536484 RepID=A0AAN6WWY2_9PEZI|nr:protein red1 [Podospora australis]